MITVSNAVERIIKSSPLLEEGLSRGLLNISALSRDIRPEVARISKKTVSEAAIMMALKRLVESLPSHVTQPNLTFETPDLIIRSQLIELTYANSTTLNQKQQKLLSLIAEHRSNYFLTITTGVFETTIIASQAIEAGIIKLLADESHPEIIHDLSSITVRLSYDMIEHTGSIAQILRRLAWHNINIVEVVSTYQELTIIVSSSDADQVFSLLRN